ncbi:MAG: hypothetical protein IJS09_06735 [Treponema sp.]|nr:hypothetical protein [Treponema sp.]
MEKSAVKQKRRWCDRFLTHMQNRSAVFLFAVVLSFFAAEIHALSDAEIRALKLTPQKELCFVGQEVVFTLELPDIDPSLARAEVPDFSRDSVARFVSARKSEIYGAEGETGTKFDFQISFSSAGTISLPPLSVYIKRRFYAIPFEKVTVYENPATIQPQVSVVFQDNLLQRVRKSSATIPVSVGETIRFTLYIRYCVQMLHFSWNLPKNAIFIETKRYDIARGEAQPKSFSPELVPVAQFTWTPLVAGEYDFPQFAIEATAYNGTRAKPATPAYRFSVNPSAVSGRGQNTPAGGHNQNSQSESLFTSAFQPAQPSADTESAALASESVAGAVSSDEMLALCKRLAALRSAERNALPFSRACSERKAFEAGQGIYAPNEPNKPLPLTLLAAAVFFALLAISFFLFRHRRTMFLFACIAMLFLGGSIWGYARLSARYAIFCGGEVSPVPEEGVSSTMVDGGVRIKMVETAGDWVYITGETCSGWVKTSALQEIK